MMKGKSEIREDIDRIDWALIRLIAERQACSQDMRDLKRHTWEPVRDNERERMVIETRTAQGKQAWIKWDVIEKLWALLLKDSRSLQWEK